MPTSPARAGRPARSRRRVRVGISACLIGQKVRYDGGHKRDRLLMETLGRRFEWVPICPEVEMGLGVPRETLRLEGDPAHPRLVFEHSRTDQTRRMRAWARSRLEELTREDLCGYILKGGSPSCGLEGVRVHPADGGAPVPLGTGLFARALLQRFPDLPMEEEGGLRDRRRRARFVERVLSYSRRMDSTASGRRARAGVAS
ncbi:MAG: DUF523 domain-containing protein [Acidobacteria bacterium]|nr:DUF523 domain-containing protein [Acidobacteriota bacterium]